MAALRAGSIAEARRGDGASFDNARPRGVVSPRLFPQGGDDQRAHDPGRARPRARLQRTVPADGPPGDRRVASRRSTVASPRHVVVCGAGVMGASVAYFLASRGVAVTVVERCGVACAASGKSGGFLALDWCDGSELGPLARASFALHAELARQLGTDYGYRRMDTFMVAARERGAIAGDHRVPAPPWLDGAGVVTAALGSPETTAQVHPARFTAALLDAAQTRGSSLRIGVVEEVVQRDGAVR